MNEMFISPSIWTIQIDTLDEQQTTEIWDLAKGFLYCSFILTYLSHLNT
jgi:hypothetical protein